MANVNGFSVFVDEVVQISLADLSGSYEFGAGGFDTNTNVFTSTVSPGGAGTNIIKQFQQLLASEVAAYFATNPDGLYERSIIVLRSDGTPDPYRHVTVVVDHRTNPAKPDNFAEMYDTKITTIEGTNTIPGVLINTPDWGAKKERWRVRFLYGQNPSVGDGLTWSNLLEINLQAKNTSGGTITLPATYWEVPNTRCVIIRHKGDSDPYTTLAGCVYPVQTFAPKYPATIFGYFYLRVGGGNVTPGPGKTNNYPYMFLHGNAAYEPVTVVPPLAQSDIYVPGGAGGSGGETTTPGGGNLPGGLPGTGGSTIPDDGVGIVPSDSLITKDPSISGGGLVTVNSDGTYNDTVGGGLAAVGAGINGGYAIVAMTLEQLSTFFNQLFSNDPIEGFLDYIASRFGNVRDAIITANIFPFRISDAGTTKLSIGLLPVGTCQVLTSQFINVDLGSVKIDKYWNSFLDYQHTKIDIYVPFVGWQPLRASDVMGRTIGLKYHIDLLSGSFVAILHVSGTDFEADLYQWTGTAAMTIPLASTSAFDPSIISSLMTIGGALAGAPEVGAAVTTTVSESTRRNKAGEVVGTTTKETTETHTPAPKPSPSVGSVLGSVLTQPLEGGSRGGGATGSAGFLGGLVPAVVIDRPVQAVPDNYGDLIGYPSEISATLGALSGYVEVETWKPAISGITAEEAADLDAMVKGGFWI